MAARVIRLPEVKMQGAAALHTICWTHPGPQPYSISDHLTVVPKFDWPTTYVTDNLGQPSISDLSQQHLVQQLQRAALLLSWIV